MKKLLLLLWCLMALSARADFSISPTPRQLWYNWPFFEYQTNHYPSSIFATLKVVTSARSATVVTYVTGSYVLGYKCGVRVNGADWTSFTPTNTGLATNIIVLPLGVKKNVEFVSSAQDAQSLVTAPEGIYLVSAAFDEDALLVEPKPAKTLVVYGDSITSGGQARVRPLQGWLPLLRRSWFGNVISESYGYRSLYADGETAAGRQALATKLAGSYGNPEVIWIAIGANDWLTDIGAWGGTGSLAKFGTAYADLVTRLHGAGPEAILYCQSPTITLMREGANGDGATLDDYRAIIAAVAATNAFCVFVDGKTLIAASDLSSDGLHPSTEGNVNYYQAVRQILSVPFEATRIPVDASGFNGNLSTAASTLQAFADEVDNLSLGGGGGTTYTNNSTGLPGVILGSGIGTNLSSLATLTQLQNSTNAATLPSSINATNAAALSPIIVQQLQRSTNVFIGTNVVITNFGVGTIIHSNSITTGTITTTGDATVGGNFAVNGLVGINTMYLTNLINSNPLTLTNLGNSFSGAFTNAGGSPDTIAYHDANKNLGYITTGSGVVTALGITANSAGGFVTDTGTATFTGKTYDGAATGNVLKFKQYLWFSGFDNATGALPINTNDYTAITYMRPRFLNGTDKASNYIEWHLIVPEDIDTSVALRGRLKFRLTGADTAAHRYVLSFADVANSASAAGSPSTEINLDFAGDGSGASGDVEGVTWTTLTSWASGLTAGDMWVIRLARDGDTSDASTVDSDFISLGIEYGATQ